MQDTYREQFGGNYNAISHAEWLAYMISKNSTYARRSSDDIYYYSREGHLDIVDLECVQCLVG